MAKKQALYTSLWAIAGLACGVAVGLLIGWQIAPVEYINTNITDLHAEYKADFILMVSETYALNGDLDTAKARIALLELADPPEAVAELAEQLIAQQAPLAHIQALARLADALGVQRDTLRPYLLPDQTGEGAP